MAKYNVIPLDDEQMFKEIAQIGLVVKDLNQIMTQMEVIFHQKKPEVVHAKPFHGFYKGEPAEYSALIAYYEDFNGVELEFIQPVTGESIWADHLLSNTTSLHHIRFNVKNFDKCVSYLADKGIGIYQQGVVSRDHTLRWCYFDSMKRLGFILEILGKN